MFQVLFHHIFVQVLDDIGHHVVSTSFYAVEFEVKGVFLFLPLRFWKDKQLCRVLRVLGRTSAEVALLSGHLAAISTRPSLVSCSGCSLELVQLVDNSSLFPLAIQSPQSFEELFLQKLMNKRTHCVFGRIDFVSVLQYLVVFLGGASAWSLSYLLLSCQRLVDGFHMWSGLH